MIIDRRADFFPGPGQWIPVGIGLIAAGDGFEAVDAIRADLETRTIWVVIPGRSNRRVKIEHDRALYKQRNQIERMFGPLKINRAMATRYAQLAETFMSMVHIATARYRLKFVHAAWVAPCC
jgi:transposase